MTTTTPDTPTLEADQTTVLRLVLSTFVGPVNTRREIERVIRRAMEEALERSEQLTADRKMRDGVAMSLERVTINGVDIPF